MKYLTSIFLGWFLIINNNVIPEKYATREQCLRAANEGREMQKLVPTLDRLNISVICIPDSKSTPKET